MINYFIYTFFRFADRWLIRQTCLRQARSKTVRTIVSIRIVSGRVLLCAICSDRILPQAGRIARFDLPAMLLPLLKRPPVHPVPLGVRLKGFPKCDPFGGFVQRLH